MVRAWHVLARGETPSLTSGPHWLCVQEIWALSPDGGGSGKPSNIPAYVLVGHVWPGLIGGVRLWEQDENGLMTCSPGPCRPPLWSQHHNCIWLWTLEKREPFGRN